MLIESRGRNLQFGSFTKLTINDLIDSLNALFRVLLVYRTRIRNMIYLLLDKIRILITDLIHICSN